MHARNMTLCAAAIGLSTLPAHADFQIEFHADENAYAIGDTMTWTVSVTGDFTAGVDYIQFYDLDIIASDDSAGTASTFADAFTPLVNPTAGTASGASISGVSGGQSSILDPLGIVYGPKVLGTFTVVATDAALLSYTVQDGGILGSTDVIQIRPGSDFAPPVFDGLPTVTSDTVLIGNGIPAPSTATALALVGLATTRRRR